MADEREFDYVRSYDIVYDLRHAVDIQNAMQRIIDVCESMRPHPDWRVLRRLPYAEEVERKTRFLHDLLTVEAPPKPLKKVAFFFYNYCNHNEDLHSDIEFYGLYEATLDWGDDCYLSDEAWVESHVLSEISRIASRKKSSLQNDAEYPLCLAHSMYLAREAVRYAMKTGVLEPMPVEAGFHDGDTIEFEEKELLDPNGG